MADYTILMIEDDPYIGRLYRRALSLAGEFKVEVADNGLFGLELAKQKKYDLVLIDIMMPGLNGFQVLEALEGASTMKGVPIIVMTNLVGEAVAQQAKTHGAVRCVIKSDQSPEDIIALVRKVIGSVE